MQEVAPGTTEPDRDRIQEQVLIYVFKCEPQILCFAIISTY